MSGYLSVKINGRKIDLHRHVWMKAYGPIPKGCVIHHKNGNKQDNRLDNLEMLTYAQHNAKHETHKLFFGNKPEWLRKQHKRALEISKDKNGLFWCNGCKSLLPGSKFSKNKSRLNGLQNQCKECRSFSRSLRA